jgi:hypothetical protein
MRKQPASKLTWKKNKQRNILIVGSLCALALIANPRTASADAGGASFWLQGIFGSLAAVPGLPGWAYTSLYIHESESAGASKNQCRDRQSRHYH